MSSRPHRRTELVYLVVAQPKVAALVAKPRLVLFPGAVEADVTQGAPLEGRKSVIIHI